MSHNTFADLCTLLRYDILTSTTAAGSGHPTSSLSAVELMGALFFDGFLHYDLKDPQSIYNDRIIFSKGHAAPLLYSLYHVAGAITEKELLTLRQFGSRLEGHPTPSFPFVDVTTGSLGQGLSIGVGMALGIRLRINTVGDADLRPLQIKRTPKVWILLGDSEMAEGQNWEAMQIASYYKLNNLIGIIDMNRIGQRGETMIGWDEMIYQKRAEAFGWKTYVIENGHNIEEITNVYREIEKPKTKNDDQPTMIIAKTIKGKGISFLEDKDGWHGKAVPKDKLAAALKELGSVDKKVRGKIAVPNVGDADLRPLPKNTDPRLDTIVQKLAKSYKPESIIVGDGLPVPKKAGKPSPTYKKSDLIATREAYGDAIVALGKQNADLVVLDGEMANSLFEEKFAKEFPDRYFEMFIAEQNMVSAALGLSKAGFTPIATSFGSFLSRAFDQIRMAQYSVGAISTYSADLRHESPLLLAGSHVGVSIGQDGASQMALEDIAMIRSILNSVILYPSDAVSTYKLVEQLLKINSIGYLRLTREKMPVIYNNNEDFIIGGSKILRHSSQDIATIFAAGITLHEALKAYEELKKQNIHVAVVDLYSVKPIDEKTIREKAQKTKNIIVVEDHYPAGGIGEAVSSVILNSFQDLPAIAGPNQVRPDNITFTHLCVKKTPHSGSPADLLRFEEIDAEAIVQAVQNLL